MRDRQVVKLFECINTYLLGFIQFTVSDKVCNAVQQNNRVKDDYINQFNQLYENVRPIIAKFPEKRNSLLANSLKVNNDSQAEHSNNFNQHMTKLCQQLKLIVCTSQSLSTLLSFYPNNRDQINLSLQFNMLFDLYSKMAAGDSNEKDKKQDKKQDKKDKQELVDV